MTAENAVADATVVVVAGMTVLSAPSLGEAQAEMLGVRRAWVPWSNDSAGFVGADRRVRVASDAERLERVRCDRGEIGHPWRAAGEADEVESTRYDARFDLEARVIGQDARIVERIGATGRAQV